MPYYVNARELGAGGNNEPAPERRNKMNLKDIQEYQKELVKEAHDYFGRYRNWKRNNKTS